jgi:hypothetical protein
MKPNLSLYKTDVAIQIRVSMYCVFGTACDKHEMDTPSDIQAESAVPNTHITKRWVRHFV